VMTRVNSLVLAYNCTAPACAAPQTPYNLAHQHARFLERFRRERQEGCERNLTRPHRDV